MSENGTAGELRIAVVVPVLNEAPRLSRLLPRLTAEADAVVVVDGGSLDDSVRVAAAVPGTDVLVCEPPRWRQLNLGASAATADALFFVHADALPPPGFAGAIRRSLTDPEVVGGAFALAIDDDGAAARVVSCGANWRTRLTGHPYGDQGLFVRRRVFHHMSGFAPWPVMEDLEFSARLARRGRVDLLPQAMRVSARRWQAQGYLRTTWRNTILAGCFYLGVDAARLRHWLDPVRTAAPRSGPGEGPS